MNTKTYIISFILIMCGVTAHSQFFVDVYYGYNHSNDPYESVLSEAFNDEFNEHITYKDTSYSTNIYNDTIGWSFHDSQFTVHKEKTSHSITFKNHQPFGANFGYVFNDYFKLSVSCDFMNFIGSSPVKAEKITDVYVYGDFTTTNTSSISLDYTIINPSIFVSFQYPYKKFVPEINLGYGMYYTEFLHTIENDYGDIHRQAYKYRGNNYGIKIGAGLAYKCYDNFYVFTKAGYSYGDILINKGAMVENDTEESSEQYLPVRINPDDIPLKNYYSALDGFNYKLGIRYKFGKSQKDK